MNTSTARTWRILLIALALIPALSLSAENTRAADRGVADPHTGMMATLVTAEWIDDAGITFTFDAAVSETDRNDIIEGARLGLDVIGGFVGNAGLAGVEIHASSDAAANSPYILAGTRGSRIDVFTGGTSWRMAPTIVRIETMVHELMHVYQNALEGSAIFSVPLWFDEGTAEALGYLAITGLGVVDQDDIYTLSLYQLTHSPVNGSLAVLSPYGSMTADSYPLAYIAVQYLLGRTGMSVTALATLYEGLGRGLSFTDAFAVAFGQRLDDFYVEFDAWRTGLLRVTSAPLDFVSPHWTPGPVPAAWNPVQTEVSRGSQLVLAVTTQPGAECIVQLRISDDLIERSATASGSGDALWLVTVPEHTPNGLLSTRASCGDTAIWQDIIVT